jgi:hypothetical protein
LEEASYDTYPKTGQVLMLMVAAVAENFGYRQLTAVWRVQGIWRWWRNADASWGRMARAASWQAADPGRAKPSGGAAAEPALPVVSRAGT